MLPRFYRFIIVNNSGQTMTYNDNARYNLLVTHWIITPSTGLIAYTQDVDDDLSFAGGSSTADGGEDLSDEIDNTSNLFEGALVQLAATHDAGGLADGTFDIYLDGGEATGQLASDASGYASAEANKLQFIGSLTWESNGLDDEVMYSPVFNV